MRVRRFEWDGAGNTANAIRAWTVADRPVVDVDPIEREVREGGDAALLELTARFDATERPLDALRVGLSDIARALTEIDPGVRNSLELAVANVRAVAEAQIDNEARRVDLPQGQNVTLRSVPVSAAGIYAPGGRAAYPSSVLMG